jgi:hypothetical protein
MSPRRGSVKWKEAVVAVGRETCAGEAPRKTGAFMAQPPGFPLKIAEEAPSRATAEEVAGLGRRRAALNGPGKAGAHGQAQGEKENLIAGEICSVIGRVRHGPAFFFRLIADNLPKHTFGRGPGKIADMIWIICRRMSGLGKRMVDSRLDHYRWSGCQKFFPLGDLNVGAQRAVPSTSGTARCVPTRRDYIWPTP